jgi:hypothetical protein
MTVFNLHFCGTECFISLGEMGGEGGPPALFAQESGYIPVRLYKQQKDKGRSLIVPGPGTPWHRDWDQLWVPPSIGTGIGSAIKDAASGASMWDLAAHATASIVGAKAAGRGKPDSKHLTRIPSKTLVDELNGILGTNFSSKPATGKQLWWSVLSLEGLRNQLLHIGKNNIKPITTVNMSGHSRGAVAAIMAAHDIAAILPNAKINIFAIDPVPGSGTLSPEMTSLPKTVTNYIGIYAIDEASPLFNGVVPKFYYKGALKDPLQNIWKSAPRLKYPLNAECNYRLIYVPGRHATMSGLGTSTGEPSGKIEDLFASVPTLVYRLAAHYFKCWGAIMDIPKSSSRLPAQTLLTNLKTSGPKFRAMRKHIYTEVGGKNIAGVSRNGIHHEERGVTSSTSSNMSDWYYLEDIIGIKPLVARARSRTLFDGKNLPGLMSWESMLDMDASEFDSERLD